MRAVERRFSAPGVQAQLRTVVSEEIRKLERSASERTRKAEREPTEAKRKSDRIVAAIEAGGAVDALSTRLRDLGNEVISIQGRIFSIRNAGRVQLPGAEEVLKRTNSLIEALREPENLREARSELRSLLVGGVCRMVPTKEGYNIAGTFDGGALLNTTMPVPISRDGQGIHLVAGTRNACRINH